MEGRRIDCMPLASRASTEIETFLRMSQKFADSLPAGADGLREMP
jgi:hypothetical protein